MKADQKQSTKNQILFLNKSGEVLNITKALPQILKT